MNSEAAIKAKVTKAVKAHFYTYSLCLTALGAAAPYASIERVQVQVIRTKPRGPADGPDFLAKAASFTGQGYAIVKFDFPCEETDVPFVFHKKLRMEFGALASGTSEMVVYEAVLRDDDYYENDQPPAELTEPEIEPVLIVPTFGPTVTQSEGDKI